MAPRGRSRQVRQVATDVPTTRSFNEAQASDEVSSNPHGSVGKRHKEGMVDRLLQKIDKRFSIERLKALGAATFQESLIRLMRKVVKFDRKVLWGDGLH
uniref:Uncharacterized protein n=1 Tax=Cucumis melo TaxID=3656 RepID=A0A9I9CUX0_CUCME